MQMETVILDLSDCKYVGALHQKIKEVFSFPDYYGENWDASQTPVAAAVRIYTLLFLPTLRVCVSVQAQNADKRNAGRMPV